jgi:hypothetical protein
MTDRQLRQINGTNGTALFFGPDKEDKAFQTSPAQGALVSTQVILPSRRLFHFSGCNFRGRWGLGLELFLFAEFGESSQVMAEDRQAQLRSSSLNPATAKATHVSVFFEVSEHALNRLAALFVQFLCLSRFHACPESVYFFLIRIATNRAAFRWGCCAAWLKRAACAVLW